MTRAVLSVALFGFCSAAFAAEKAPKKRSQRRWRKEEKERRRTRGLVAHYYNDPVEWDGNWTPDSEPVVDSKDWTFTAYDRTRIEPLVNRFFVRRGWFSVRWKGLVTIPERGGGTREADVSFEIWADDGCRLYIDGVKVIDDWRPMWEENPASRRSASIRLETGKHRIVIEYFQGQSLPRRDKDPMKLYWSCPERNVPRQIVPASAFSHAAEDLIPEPGRLDQQEQDRNEPLRVHPRAGRRR